jgi:hypothetical protein
MKRPRTMSLLPQARTLLTWDRSDCSSHLDKLGRRGKTIDVSCRSTANGKRRILTELLLQQVSVLPVCLSWKSEALGNDETDTDSFYDSTRREGYPNEA